MRERGRLPDKERERHPVQGCCVAATATLLVLRFYGSASLRVNVEGKAIASQCVCHSFPARALSGEQRMNSSWLSSLKRGQTAAAIYSSDSSASTPVCLDTDGAPPITGGTGNANPLHSNESASRNRSKQCVSLRNSVRRGT